MKSTQEEQEQESSSTANVDEGLGQLPGGSDAGLTNASQSAEFVEISGLLDAGVSVTNKNIFYKRAGFQSLSKFVDKIVKGCHLGLIDGLPGTGKSSTLWWKLRQQSDFTMVWVHMNRAGTIDTIIKVARDKSEYLELPDIVDDFWRDKMPELSDPSSGISVVVVDGVNHTAIRNAQNSLNKFVLKDAKNRCAFITMSNKIKKEHRHQLAILEKRQAVGTGVALYYHTLHSWTLAEYLNAYVNPDTGGATDLFRETYPVFQKDWKNIDVDGTETSCTSSRKRQADGSKKYISVEEAVTQKFAFAGGSARWMACEDVETISTMISDYMLECIRLDILVTFTLGEESPFAQTHLYFSQENGQGLTLYSLISQHATILAVKSLGEAGTKTLYQHAIRLDNPAFTGWVIEADVMQRCTVGPLKLMKSHRSSQDEMSEVEVSLTSRAQEPVEFNHDALVAGAAATELVPETGKTNVCKPTMWNQGGYDVVFVTALSEKNLALLFGQVTKSITHSLKLKYFAEAVTFLRNAGYVIDSVEIGFIVKKQNMSKFRIFPSQVYGRGLLFHADLPASFGGLKWKQGQEENLVSVYGIDLAVMGYHN